MKQESGQVKKTAGAKRGRKTKFKPAFTAKAVELAKKGACKKEIASALGISEESFYQYTKQFPEFAESVRQGYEKATADVLAMNYQCAMGLAKRSRVYGKFKRGKKVPAAFVEEQLAPSVHAQEIWLRAHRPDQFGPRPDDNGAKRIASVKFIFNVINPDGTKKVKEWDPQTTPQIPSLDS